MLIRPRRLLASAVASVTMALGVGLIFAFVGVTGSATSLASSHLNRFHIAVSIAGVHANVVQSNNWAGYDEGLLDTSNLATSVSGEWTVPTATQHTSGQAESAANWVGIGGGCVDMTSGCAVTDPTLIQAGTEEDVSATGQASYSAWWEILPAPSISASVTVNPGDKVSVSISGPGLWTIQFNDLTNGQSFTETVPYTSPLDTAEWIEEAPVVVSASGTAPAAGEATLPNLKGATFSDSTLNGANPGFVPGYEMQMVDSNGNVIATPSAPNSSQNGFNVCSYSSTCAAP